MLLKSRAISLIGIVQIVDFTIWQMFRQNSRSSTRFQHLLCQGFQKDVNLHTVNRNGNLISAIPGLVSTYPNSHVTALKASPWPQVRALMGKGGHKVMIDLILDCGVFVAVETGMGNYYQLSGKPLQASRSITADHA